MSFVDGETEATELRFLQGGGACGALIRAIDWSQSPLGAPETWPLSLRVAVGIILHSRHPMFLWWGEDLIQFYNDGYLPSFGRGKHPRAMGQRGSECWTEIWPIIHPQIEAVMKHGIPSWNEDQLVPIFRNQRIEEVYWTYGYSAVFDEKGAIVGTLVVCTETTHRLLLERRLCTLRMLSDSSASATDRASLIASAGFVFEQSIRDIPFAVLYNKAPESNELTRPLLFGITEEDAERAVTPRVIAYFGDHPDLESASSEALSLGAEVVDGKAWPEPITTVAIESTPKSNLVFVLGLSPRLPFDDEYRAFLGQAREQFVRAQARIDALVIRARAALERDNLLSQAPVATAVLVGPNHVFQLANPLYCQFVGRENLVGRSYREAFPELVDTDLPRILDEVYRTGEPYIATESLVPLARNGGPVEDCFFNFTLEAMRDAEGNVYGMMAVAFDVTDQVRARQARERSNEDRDQLLADRERANRTKDEFLAMLGHELRNPLAPIVTALKLLKMKPGAETTKELTIIERQVAHLTRLVDDLLDVSKITRGKVELKKELVDVSQVVAQAVELASTLLEKREHHLRVEVTQGLRWRGDPTRLAQVVANLLTNAARYTKPGGNIELHASSNDGDIVIRVKDNGMGIRADLLPRIFDVFVQGQQTPDRAEGGLGIGLALVKNLVEMHQGTVRAHSEGIDRGSEFVIRLPGSNARRPSYTGLKPIAPKPDDYDVPQRVMIVDDNEDSADMLSEMLSLSGHITMVANDPVEALNVAPGFRPDVALLDIGLPAMDGYELARLLHAKPELSQCRMIAVTGYGQDHDRARSGLAGFEHHLIKPVDIDELRRVISEGIRNGGRSAS